MNRFEPPTRRSSARAGFTLLEITVVIVIIGIMGALIVPRLLGNQTREFKLAVEQVGDLLTMYAQRSRLDSKVVGIGFDRYANSLQLMSVADDDGSGQASWTRDFYVQPVLLPRFMADTDIEFEVDGDRADPADWPISSDPGQPRPMIAITMRGAGEMATLQLLPYAVAPVLSSTYQSSGVMRDQVDLDQTGRNREDW